MHVYTKVATIISHRSVNILKIFAMLISKTKAVQFGAENTIFKKIFVGSTLLAKHATSNCVAFSAEVQRRHEMMTARNKFFLIFWQIKIKEFTLKIIFLTSKKVIFGAYLKALRKFAKGNTLDYIKISLSVIKQLRG